MVAHAAGFAFVDVKACHGYLLHELLSGVDRPGPFGGDLEGRSRFLCRTISGIRDRVPGLAVGVRLSAFALAPHVPGPNGTGVAEAGVHHAFGGDGTEPEGHDEVDRLLAVLADLGVGTVCVTAGSPYYCPHAQRPAFFPPSDGYLPPRDPLVDVARLVGVAAPGPAGRRAGRPAARPAPALQDVQRLHDRPAPRAGVGLLPVGRPLQGHAGAARADQGEARGRGRPGRPAALSPSNTVPAYSLGMPEIRRLLDANRAYVDDHHGFDGPRPRRRIAIVTCMDARIDVFAALGLELGDAHVIRNAGGRVTDDVLRSLALSSHALGTTSVVVMQHTRCGLAGVSNTELEEVTGAGIEFFVIDDHVEALRSDLQRIRDTPYLGVFDEVVGFVLDIDTGAVTEVVDT